MENKVLKLGGGRSTQDIPITLIEGSSNIWTIQSQGPALIRMVMLLALTTIYRVIHTLQQKQSDWVPILLRKFQTPF